MMSNVAVSVVEQLQGRDLVEVNEYSKDDTEEEGKKEKETEKETYTLRHDAYIKPDAFQLSKGKRSLIFENDDLISEYHASLPELPPEA